MVRLQKYIQQAKKKINLFPVASEQKQHLTLSVGTFPAISITRFKSKCLGFFLLLLLKHQLKMNISNHH